LQYDLFGDISAWTWEFTDSMERWELARVSSIDYYFPLYGMHVVQHRNVNDTDSHCHLQHDEIRSRA
jgi:hypothetical protein